MLLFEACKEWGVTVTPRTEKEVWGIDCTGSRRVGDGRAALKPGPVGPDSAADSPRQPPDLAVLTRRVVQELWRPDECANVIVTSRSTVVDGTGAEGKARSWRSARRRGSRPSGATSARPAHHRRHGVPGDARLDDPHTHLDAQLFWDPGDRHRHCAVTTVVLSSCGFGPRLPDPGRATGLLHTLEVVEEIHTPGTRATVRHVAHLGRVRRAHGVAV